MPGDHPGLPDPDLLHCLCGHMCEHLKMELGLGVERQILALPSEYRESTMKILTYVSTYLSHFQKFSIYLLLIFANTFSLRFNHLGFILCVLFPLCSQCSCY